MPECKQLPMLTARAAVQPKTFDADKRTVELTWSAGATVRRFDFWDGPYLEELSMNPAHVRMERLNNGAPLLGNHNAFDLSGVIGVVERAWIDEGKGRAVVRFSERADVEPILADVKSGILRNVSVGYHVHEYNVEKPTERGGMPLYRAVDWEPMEISVVTVPADASAQIRGSTELHPVQLTTRTAEMADPNDTQVPEEEAPANPAPETPNEAEITARAAKAERQRVAGIIESVRAAKLDNAFADKLIASGKPLDDCRNEVIRAWSASVDKTATPSRVDGGETSGEKWLRGAEQSILARSGMEKDDPANEFRGHRLIDFARMALERSGTKTYGMTYESIAQTVCRSQTTSDFAVLLENSMHKMLIGAYAAAPDKWRAISKIGTVSDFRAWKRLRTGVIGNLDAVLESGELTNKTVPDAEAESVQVTRYGNIVSITPEVIVNDDLGKMNDLVAELGRAAARTIEAAVFAKVVANPTMGDGYALFSTQHGNIVTAGGSITVTTLDAAGAAMAIQTDITGTEYLDITPSVLVCTRSEYNSARVVVTAPYDPDTASKLQRPNPVRDIVSQVIGTPRISVGWYLFADPAVAPVIEVVFLDGNQSPRIQFEESFRTKGLNWSVELPFGVGVIDYRGAYFNDGVN